MYIYPAIVKCRSFVVYVNEYEYSLVLDRSLVTTQLRFFFEYVTVRKYYFRKRNIELSLRLSPDHQEQKVH